jgi:hypothetical protein
MFGQQPGYLPHMKESKSMLGFEPTVARDKWFEVNEIFHSATDAPKIKYNILQVINANKCIINVI